MKTRRNLILLTAIILLTACSKNPVSVLLVTGGHNFDTLEFFQLFRSMEEFAFDSVSHPEAMELLSSGKRDFYDLILFYDYVPDMEPKDSVIFLTLARQGKPMLFLHHSLCSFQKWEGFKQIVGGKYVMPGYSSDTSSFSDYRHDIDLSIEVLDPTHPVCSGIDNFTIHDEGYSNILLEDQIHPLFGTDHPDCSPVVGWVNRFDRSTCICLMFGHDKQAYANESLKMILRNSIQWLGNQ